MDFLGAYQDIQSVQLDAKNTTNQMGPGAQGYYQDTIKSEISKELAKLNSEQKAGRSAYGVSAGQFHVGGTIGGFGSMADGPDEGWIRAQRGEFIVQQGAALPHYQALQAINGGASHADMARYYGGAQTQAAAITSGDTHHWTVHALDSRSVEEMLMSHSGAVRGAYNASQSDYSGQADV